MENHSSGRLDNVLKNIFWSTLAQVCVALMGLISRKIFLRTLGDELLGVNSLFASVLGLFSFAELGFGSAIGFLLYRPIAEGDREKVRSLLRFYEKAYLWVAGFLMVISLGFFPFLNYLKTEIPLNELRVYYILYQFNSILGYLFVFRDSYVEAIQRERDLTRISLAFSLSTTIVQVIVISLGGSFLQYLLIGSCMLIARKLTTNILFRRRYPETILRGAKPLEPEDRKLVFQKVRALFVHRIANVCISQTDSLIVSYMINVLQWGFVSNYSVLRGIITSVLDRISAAIIPSMGNMIVAEGRQKELDVFQLYNFWSHWIYAFCFVCLASLSSPFVALFYGTYRVLPQTTVFVFFFAFYISGMRDSIGVLREANGSFEQDQWVTVAAAVVNLISSILFVYLVGLPGVFLGTICCMMVFVVVRPILLFRQYETSVLPYFKDIVMHTATALIGYGMVQVAFRCILDKWKLTIFIFFILCIIAVILPNGLWVCLYCREPAFQKGLSLLKSKLTRRRA